MVRPAVGAVVKTMDVYPGAMSGVVSAVGRQLNVVGVADAYSSASVPVPITLAVDRIAWTPAESSAVPAARLTVCSVAVTDTGAAAVADDPSPASTFASAGLFQSADPMLALLMLVTTRGDAARLHLKLTSW